MPYDFELKQLKLKRGEDQGRYEPISLEVQVRSLHAHMDPPQAEGNFCDNCHNPVKPHIVQ